jgi:error-prone DNA polymerase
MVAIRHRGSLEGAEQERRGNHECVLLEPDKVGERFPDDHDAVARTVELAARLEFDLTQELGYRYPDFSDRDEPAIAELARVCNRAFEARYRLSNRLLLSQARSRLEEELALIDELGLAGFFLLHWEVLELAAEVAREVRGRDTPRHSLPPGRGRGSSVGSLVCYLTGLSHVDPVEAGLSLGRFLNRELDAVPDIDLDFPRDIREKLIVALTERYGHEHAALVASFSTYRSRGAIRDLGKALGLPFAELERLARVTEGSPKRVAEEIAKLPDGEAKLRSRRWRALGVLAKEIAGLPRYISQHPGGMVISSRPLIDLVPVQPAAMEGRQICQWDKDSCADAGFLKIDLLGLGMLSAVEDCVVQIAETKGKTIDLSRIQLDDPDVYDEIQNADTVGDFQIESRAQMQSLLRTRPENLDDLTIQVALVRPGPIQGKAVHPYIDHRQRLREDPSFVPPVDHPLLAEPLRETLGVVVFQDQVLEVAIALAGFSVGEAEGLRRAMSRKRSEEAIEAFRGRFVEGAVAKGVDAKLADEVYDKLVGFSGFGFPKSHAAAFGLLAYQSAWLRHHHPAEFLCALLNAQPMGFYPPASLVRDAQRRGVEVRPPDINKSQAKCTIELSNSLLQGAVRIGLEYVASIGGDDAKALAEAAPFANVVELAQRTSIGHDGLESLIASGACDSLGESRRALLWELGLVPRSESVPGSGGEERQLALPLDPTAETPDLPVPTEWEDMLASYRQTSLSVDTHPMELLRPHLPATVLSSHDLCQAPDRARVAVAGMAVARQRPATAKGVVFMLLEDEFGQVNLIVPPQVYERHRAIVRGEPLILAHGTFERVERNQNVVVRKLETLAPIARRLSGAADLVSALPDAHHFGHR